MEPTDQAAVTIARDVLARIAAYMEADGHVRDKLHGDSYAEYDAACTRRRVARTALLPDDLARMRAALDGSGGGDGGSERDRFVWPIDDIGADDADDGAILAWYDGAVAVVAAARQALAEATRPPKGAVHWCRGNVGDAALAALGDAIRAYDAAPPPADGNGDGPHAAQDGTGRAGGTE